MASITVTQPAKQQDNTTAELRISEIFYSIQGESNKTGLPSVFVRLTGCPLRCQYCDTAYAFHGGDKMHIDDILAEISKYRTRHITVTGGEPLVQPGCLLLLKQLCDRDYEVSLETGGALDVSIVDPRVIKIMDIKTPGSGEEHRNNYYNLACLTERDQIKCVICDRQDYEWAREKLLAGELPLHCEILFSPSHDQLDARVLADWILADQLPVRLQVQLHKYLWGNVPGH